MSADAVTAASPHVRLRVELVVEVADPAALTRAALDHLAEDDHLPAAERLPATEAVAADPAEALSYLIDPFDLVKGVPGVELAQASWGSEQTGPGAFEDSDWVDEV